MAFEKKLSNLLGKQEVNNAFITQALKESNVTTSGNDAKKYSTSGDDFVDNFAAISQFKSPRSYQEVSKDMAKRYIIPEKIWKAHEEGLIHGHDFDYLIQHEHNCCLVNLKDMLENGTVISNKIVSIGSGRQGYERVYEYKGNYYTMTGIGTNGFIVSAYPVRKDDL